MRHSLLRTAGGLDDGGGKGRDRRMEEEGRVGTEGWRRREG